MTDVRNLIHGTAAALATLALAATQTAAAADKPQMEKCGGVVKAGKNDCGTSKHSCAGQAKQGGDAEEWVYVPKGTCEKLVGGKPIMTKKDK